MLDKHRTISGKQATPLGPQKYEIGLFDVPIWEAGVRVYYDKLRVAAETAAKYEAEPEVISFPDAIITSSRVDLQDLAGAIYDNKCFLPEVTWQELAFRLEKLHFSISDVATVRKAIFASEGLIQGGSLQKETLASLRFSVQNILEQNCPSYVAVNKDKKFSPDQVYMYERDVWQVIAARKVDSVWSSKGDKYTVMFYTRNAMLARVMPFAFDNQSRELRAVQYDVAHEYQPFFTYNIAATDMDAERKWEAMLRVRKGNGG